MEISCRIYKPRRARESPLFRLVEQHLEELLRVWPTRFARQHGPLRPVVERVLRGFMRCGLVEHGFARLWCPTCRTSVLCPFSCRGRSFCLSCEKPSGPFRDVYSVMNAWGANHGAICYGHVGADILSLASMLRIPVSMHNVAEEDVFRPSAWGAFGAHEPQGADFRACATLGPLYGR